MIHLLAYCLAPSLGYEPHMGKDQIVLFTKVYPVPWHSLAYEKCKINVHWMNGMNEWMNEWKAYGRTLLDSGFALTGSGGLLCVSSLRPWQGRASFNPLCSEPSSPVPSQATAWPSRHFCDLPELLSISIPLLRLTDPYSLILSSC